LQTLFKFFISLKPSITKIARPIKIIPKPSDKKINNGWLAITILLFIVLKLSASSIIRKLKRPCKRIAKEKPLNNNLFFCFGLKKDLAKKYPIVPEHKV
jgi:hypothetical protein